MGKAKKPTKFKNVLESLDQFKIEHNFQYTKKEAKGTLIGFCFSVIYVLALGWYFYNRMSLFWSHDEDSYSVYDVVNDMKEPIEFKEAQFIKGVILQTSAKEYEQTLLDDDEISQFINIYSAQAELDGKSTLDQAKFSKIKKLEKGCDGDEYFNTTRFTRISTLNPKFCIDKENEYDLNGNFETPGTSKMIFVNIDRCKASPT